MKILWTALAAAAAAAPAHAVEPIAAQQPLPLGELAQLSGGTNVVDAQTLQMLSAYNGGNSVAGNTIGSGAIMLHEQALQGFNGIGNFVINSGHNNNLQGSISVTVIVPGLP